MSFAGMMTGMLIWMVSTVWNKHAYPLSVFVYPTQILIVVLHSYRYGELK